MGLFSSKQDNKLMESKEYVKLSTEFEILKTKLEQLEMKFRSLKGLVSRKLYGTDEEEEKNKDLYRGVLLPE